MTAMQIRLRMFVPIVLILALSVVVACKDEQLQDLATALNRTAKSLTVIQTALKNANSTTPKLISDQTTDSIALVLINVNAGVLHANELTRELASLDSISRGKLNSVLTPLIVTIDKALVDQNIANIQDAQTKTRIRDALLAIQTSLASAQVILASR